jgi:predicted HicB family RNase H-like nuclease
MSGKKAAKAAEWTTSDGQVFTEDDAARLAREFEADDNALDGVEITLPRKVGRPSLTGGAGTSPQVSFRLSPSVRERAERLAADRGTTVSALAREALEQFVRQAG